MFDHVLQELNLLKNGIRVPVSMPVDDAGYLDRVCPSPMCAVQFKVLFEDWKSKVTDERAYCAVCRHEAQPNAFTTQEQQAHMRSTAKSAILGRLGRAFQSSAEAFNSRQRHGFITLRLDYRAPAIRIPMPPEAEEAMTLRITCQQCGCRYAVIGVGYFCPACGHNSADTTFEQSMERARAAMAALPTVKDAIVDKDAAAQTEQTLIEGTFSNLVTAFQHFAATVYPKLPNATATPRRNAFQNLAEGSHLWQAGGGRTYADILDERDIAALTRLFQQRHLLQHTQGIVDQDYLDRTGDTSYVVGQRVVIREAAALKLADLLTKLVTGMRDDIV